MFLNDPRKLLLFFFVLTLGAKDLILIHWQHVKFQLVLYNLGLRLVQWASYAVQRSGSVLLRIGMEEFFMASCSFLFVP